MAEQLLGRITAKYGDTLYVVFRIVFGYLFFQHGAQKLFGMLGGNVVPVGSLFFVAGVIELVGGLAILLGFFTRLAALGGVLDMIGALFIAHFPNGLNPIQNGGELAALYLFAFLLVLAYGARKWNLEQAILKKEIF